MILFIFSCNDENSQASKVVLKPSKKNVETEKSKDERQEMKRLRQLSIDSSEKYSSIDQFVKKYEKEYSIKIPYYFEVNNKRYYLVLDKEFLAYNGPENGSKMGVLNDQGEFIVPMKYDRVFNPNALKENCVEVMLRGNYGLISLEGGTVLTSTYKQIYPGFDNYELVVWDGNILEGITSDSKRWPIERKDLFNSRNIQNWKYILEDEIPFRHIDWEFDGLAGYDEEGTGHYFPPSYLVDLGAMDTLFSSVLVGENQYLGLSEVKTQVETIEENEGGVLTAVSSFFKQYTDARGESIHRKVISNINHENELYYKKITYETNFNSCRDTFLVRILDEHLIEVRKAKWFYGGGYFSHGDEYSYAWMEENGKITDLQTTRMFAFTKYVKIDNSYLEGCWMKRVRTEGEYTKYHQLTIDDLNVMRNEIFAEYGYRFKSEKWMNYFGEFDWYEPRFDNVDDQLTDIDKANIDFILKMKKQYEEQGEPKVDTIGWGAAG